MMASASGGSSNAINEEQLDFEQAMRDFRVMFPSLDAQIIEAVLRTNKGAVDDTIDQLLTISMDDSPVVFEETSPKVLDDQPQSARQLYVPLSSPRAPSVPSHLPSVATAGLITHIPDPDSVSPDLLPSVTQKKKKVYKPPLIGQLPQDFLRLSQPNAVDVRSMQLDDIYDNLEDQRHKACSYAKKRAESADAAYYSPDTYLGVFKISGRHRRKGWEHAQTTEGSPRRRKKYEETKKQADLLKDMMAENQWQRQVAEDPELTRYLEDERIALMLQNREFMKHLRRNRDFMSALDRDSLLMDFERREKHSKPKTSKRRSSDAPPLPDGPLVPHPAPGRKSLVDSPAVPDGPPVSASAENSSRIPEVIDSPSREESIIEGYDIDGADVSGPAPVEPFPYTKNIQKSDEPDLAFHDKIKNMSKTSKQKFALMARRFSRKTKGAKGLLGSSDSNYSGMNLLDETDDLYDSALDAGGYNQPEADFEYGISNRTDLKEGRLFPK